MANANLHDYGRINITKLGMAAEVIYCIRE